MTQQILAEILGVDVTTVSRWERGLVEPEPGTKKALEKIMDLPYMPMEGLKNILDMQANGGSIIDCESGKFLYSNKTAKDAFAALGIPDIEGEHENTVFYAMPGNEGNTSGVRNYSEILDKLGGTYIHDGGVVQVTVKKFYSDPGEVLLARAERLVLGHNPYNLDGID